MLNWADAVSKTTRISQWAAKGQSFQLRIWWSLFMVAGSVFLACVSPTIASAGAFRIFDQSASGTAQGGAFTAQADDPSAIFYNPAGLTQLRGVQTSFGTLLIGGHTSYTSPTGVTPRGLLVLADTRSR